MIVITSKNKRTVCATAGDEFTLIISEYKGRELIEHKLTERITKPLVVDVFGSFRFLEDDGTLAHPHLCGFFGNTKDLPPELLTAVHVDDLEQAQQYNYFKSMITMPSVSDEVTQLPSGVYAVNFFARFKRWLGL